MGPQMLSVVLWADYKREVERLRDEYGEKLVNLEDQAANDIAEAHGQTEKIREELKEMTRQRDMYRAAAMNLQRFCPLTIAEVPIPEAATWTQVEINRMLIDPVLNPV